MSLKHSITTAEYLNWDVAINLVRRLYREEDYRMSLLIGCGCFFGLRISDLLTLKWDMITGVDTFTLVERKTGKRREIKINNGFREHIADCYRALMISNGDEYCFINKNGDILTTQYINRKLKRIRNKYHLTIDKFSTHSLRKTFARRIWENENAAGRGEQSLTTLSEILNHASVAVTRRYIGLRQFEIGKVYEALSF